MNGGRDVLIGRFPVCAMETLVGLESGHHMSEVHLCENVMSELFFDFNKLFFVVVLCGQGQNLRPRPRRDWKNGGSVR